MNFIQIPKNIPERKYLIINAFESTWSSNHILGTATMKIDGPVMISLDGYFRRYEPLEIVPVKDPDLNAIGVHHILYVYGNIADNYDINRYKESNEYKQELRDHNLEEVLKETEEKET